MPPKRRVNDGVLDGKGGGNWGPPTRHLGRKRAGRVVGGVQRPAPYPTGRVAIAEIIKYSRDGGYLIPKAPFYRLCQEIVGNLELGQRFRWQRHQQKNDLRPAEATHVLTDCVRPMRPVHPDRPPDVFSHPMRLVPPNAFIPPPMHPARLLRPPSFPTPPSSFPSSTSLV